MKNSILYTFCLFFSVIILSSCIVLRTDSESLTNVDYNKRVTITNAHYDHVLSTFGIATITAGTLTGAFLGYKSSMFTTQDGINQNTFKIGGLLVAGSIGFISTKYINHVFGWGKVTYPENPQEWITKTNNDYILLSQTNAKYFTIIHKSAEDSFIVKNIQDVRDFVITFPNSKNSENIVYQSIKTLERNDIPELIAYYPNTTYLVDLQYKYLTLSKTIEECIEAKNKYTILKNTAEKKASKLITNATELITFENSFSHSKYLDSVILNLIYKDIDNIGRIYSLFSKTSYPELTNLWKYAKEYNGYKTYTWSYNLGKSDKYEGEWLNGTRTKGTITYSSGNKYVGNFSDGKFNGEGVFYYVSGGKYSGNWKNGKMEGYGTIYYQDSWRYVGNWVANQRVGFGKLYDDLGVLKFEGTFKDDEKSQGTYYYDNNKYVGSFDNGLENGYGTLYFDNKDYYSGNWLNGYQNGSGKYYWANGNYYDGNWSNGNRNGYGTIYNSKGQWQIKGTWYNDECNNCDKYSSFSSWDLGLLIGIVGVAVIGYQGGKALLESFAESNSYNSTNNDYSYSEETDDLEKEMLAEQEELEKMKEELIKKENEENEKAIIKVENVKDCITEFEKEIVLTDPLESIDIYGDKIFALPDINYFYNRKITGIGGEVTGWYIQYGSKGPYSSKTEVIKAYCEDKYKE